MDEKTRRSQSQMFLPGIIALQVGSKRIPMPNQKIPHKAILKALQGPPDSRGNIAAIYRRKVLTGKTRTIQLLGRKGPARIIRTLLGYEVQGGYKRVLCPDMVTARYLRLFMTLGCRSIKLSYDPTATEALLPDLERAFDRIGQAVGKMFAGAPETQAYVLRRVYRHLRQQLKSIETAAPEPRNKSKTTANEGSESTET